MARAAHFKVTTLGQPLEVVKTQMASNRTQTMTQALSTVWSRGGVMGFYQGLIPWAWIEASSKGAVLLFTASEIEKVASNAGVSPGSAGLLGGMGGGIAQAYATMGKCSTAGRRWEDGRSKRADWSKIRFLHLHEDGRNHPPQAS